MSRILIAAFAASVFAFQSPLSAQAIVSPTAAQPHSHAEHGPHGGELLEVGKEEYHIELIIEEQKKELFVYLMDSQIKSFVALDLPFLAVNLVINGKPTQFKLKPAPQEIDLQGFSSKFGITSPELVDAIHGGHADARLALKVGSKAYTVKLVHHHDHAGHNHGPVKK